MTTQPIAPARAFSPILMATEFGGELWIRASDVSALPDPIQRGNEDLVA